MEVKITKLKELEDALNPNNIPENWSSTFLVHKDFFREPELNKRFWLGSWSTSGVQEIIDKNTFRTYSSIYHWEVLEDEKL